MPYEMLTRGELVRAARRDYPEMTSHQQATQVLTGMAPDFLTLLAIEWLALDIDNDRRSDVRVVERASVTPRPNARIERIALIREATDTYGATIARWGTLLTQTFRLGSEDILYGEATADQLEASADREESRIAGTLETISMRRAMAAYIRTHNASTLGEAVGAIAA